jgi:hypothetical protein
MLSLAASGLALFSSLTPQETGKTAYLNGDPVELEITQPGSKEKPGGFGPWKLGAKVGESKPHDTRLNLYIVVPGDDFFSESPPASHYNHNRVINMAPKENDAADFDVYWAIALEPHLYRDFQSESDLLTAAQKRFIPGDLFALDDAPGAAVLRSVLHFDTLADLKPYRRKDGSLPQLLILPARFAVRASIAP